VVFIVFKSPPVQTYLTSIIAAKLSDKFKAKVSIRGVDISFFKSIILHNVYLEDRNNDTLLFVKHLVLNIDNVKFKKKEINIRDANLYLPYINLQKSNQGILNVQFLFDFLSDTTSSSDSSTFKFNVKKIRIYNGKFKYRNFENSLITENKINFDDIYLKKLNFNIDDLAIFDDSILFNINNISFVEKSGFTVKHFTCNGYYVEQGIYLNNLMLKTESSIVRATIFNIKTQHPEDFEHFVEKAQFEVNFITSKIHSNDIAYFSETLKSLKQYALIDGKVKGTLSSLRLRDFRILFKQKTFVQGNYDIEGLIISDNPYLSLRLNKLKTNIQDFNDLKLSNSSGIASFNIPKEIISLGNIFFKGELLGFANDFVVYGKLQTNLGKINTDISVKYDTIFKKTFINGSVLLDNFAIGKMLKLTPLLNNTSLSANVNMELYKNKIKGTTKANVQFLDFNQYTYQNINIDGNFTERLFDGSLQLNDPNIKIDFLGKIDYSTDVPVFNFMADIQNARLNKINLIHPDSSIVVSFLLDSKIIGSNLDKLNGIVDLYQVKYENKQKRFLFPNIRLFANNINGNKQIKINSNFLDFMFEGNFQFQDLVYNIQSLLDEYFPSLKLSDKHQKLGNNPLFKVDMKLHIKEKSDFLKEIFPEIYISNNTNVSGFLSYPNQIKLYLKSDSIIIKNVSLQSLNINVQKEDKHLETKINIDKVKFLPALCVNQFTTRIISNNNKNELYINWLANDSIVGDGELSSVVTLNNKGFNLFLNPSRININSLNWYINDGNISITDSVIDVRDIIVNENEQYLLFNGKLGNKITDSLNISIENFNLSIINPFVESKSINVNGIFNGNLLVRSALNKPIFTTDAIVSKLQLNNEDLGDMKILAEWNDELHLLSYEANAYRGNINTLQIKGIYDSNKFFDANIRLDKWRLNTIEPFVSSFANNIKGIASGSLTLKGKIESPIIEGKLELTKTAFTIPLLNVRYNFTGEVDILKDAFLIKGIDIYDEEINKALLSGKISHSNFSNFYINLTLSTNRFLFMNTKYSDTTLYYGSVYASGIVNIKGNTENIDISANVQTEKGTKFNLNLESRDEVARNDFIKIVNKNVLNIEKQSLSKSSGLTLNFNIQATPDANVQLIFDSKVGDIIKSQGTGNLKLELKSNGDFHIYGNYIISNGDYLFTLQNVINKKFEISSGSVVSFSGDPLTANIDIKATYKLRTSLYELMLDSAYKNRVLVECELFLKNKLLSPEFNFKINIPNADSRVEGVISTLSAEEINKQIISLLVLNRFVTPESYKSGIKSVEYTSPNVIGVNSSELLTNQLNHWLSQISKTVNLGLNYRPGSIMTNEELELALNTQILNDRVTINTNFGVSNNTQNESSMLIGDFDVEVKISKSGKLRAKGFNRTNSNILKDTSPYTQGVGIFYREEFDSWQSLFASYWNMMFARKREE